MSEALLGNEALTGKLNPPIYWHWVGGVREGSGVGVTKKLNWKSELGYGDWVCN